MAGEVAVLVGEGVDEDQALGWKDLLKSPLAPHLDAVGGTHAIVENASGDEVEMTDGDGESGGSEPFLEMLLFGPGGEEECAGGIEDTGNGEFLGSGGGWDGGALVAWDHRGLLAVFSS
jgi:hypothetical protein